MRSLADKKTTVAVLTGLTLVGTLAGCSTAAPAAEVPTDTEPTEAAEAPTTETDTAGDSAYVDGTYNADGTYQSPNGTETVHVTVTLADEIITAVEVVGEGGSPNSVRFQGEFAGGIAAVVVGKDIDDISVTKVAGSSLTSGGFNAAIEQIKADAAS